MEIKFCVEDTVDKCYRDFTASLLSKGWKKIPFRKRTKMEKKRFVHFYKCVILLSSNLILFYSPITIQTSW